MTDKQVMLLVAAILATDDQTYTDESLARRFWALWDRLRLGYPQRVAKED